MLKEKIKNSFIIVYAFYFIALFIDKTTFVVDYNFIAYITKAVRYLTYVYFVVRLAIMLPEYKKDIDLGNFKNKSKLEKISICLIFILGACCVINVLKTHYTDILILLVILLSAYKVDYKKIIKCTLILQISLTSLTVLGSVLGLTQNFEVARGTDVRYSLGFTYPNTIPRMICLAILLYVYGEDFKIKYFELFSFQLLNAVMYFISDTRTEFIILEAVIIFMFLYKIGVIKKLKKLFKGLSNIFVHTFFLYPILNFVLVMLYPNGGIFYKINSLLSNRLKQVYNDVMEYGLTFFGENIEYIGNGIARDGTVVSSDIARNYVDSGYLKIMFNQGTIFIIIFIILLNILIYLLYKKKKYKELFAFAFYLLMDLINSTIVNLVYCPMLFLLIPTFMEYFKEKRTMVEAKEGEVK